MCPQLHPVAYLTQYSDNGIEQKQKMNVLKLKACFTPLLAV